MDDNFANIIKGIKQGRTIFDILKKIIGYNIATNMAEFTTILGYFIFAFPIPLTTIMILTIDVGSNIYVNIAFAYERAESSIMERPPRNSKTENLCSLKLFGWSYFFPGIIMGTAGYLGYFVTLSYLGFRVKGIFNFSLLYGIEPTPNDVYNKYDLYKGNSNAFIYENADYLGIYGDKLQDVNNLNRQIDYISEVDNAIDMRIMFYQLTEEDYWGECAFPGLSQKGDSQLCYTLEAIRHAQSSFLANIILTQVANCFAFRTITYSMIFHIVDNWNLNFAYIVENIIVSCLLYIPGLNTGFGFRAIRFEFWVPCMAVFVIFFIFCEFNKYLIRNIKNPDGSKGFFAKYFQY